jgi:hypothetical protein
MNAHRWRATTALIVLARSFVFVGCSQSQTPRAPAGTAGMGGSARGAAGHGGTGAGPKTGGGGETGGAGTGTAVAGTTGSGGEGGSATDAGAAGASAAAGAGGERAGEGGSSAGSVGTGGAQFGVGGHAGGGNSGGSGPDGGAGGSSCPGLICEDFETGSIDPAKWDTSSKGGTLAVQTQQVAHGEYALHLQGLGSGSDAWATLFAKTVSAALKSATKFGRASMYFSAGVSASLHVQFPFAGSNGTGSGTGPAPLTKLRYLEVGSYSG